MMKDAFQGRKFENKEDLLQKMMYKKKSDRIVQLYRRVSTEHFV